MIARFLAWLFARRVIVSEDYLVRWHLIPENKRFNIFLHRMNGPDAGRHLHDHPWDFTTIPLWGSYQEDVPNAYGYGGTMRRRVHSSQWHPAEYTHIVRSLDRTPTWTLVFTGRRRRVWGFHTAAGWISHDQYIAEGETHVG